MTNRTDLATQLLKFGDPDFNADMYEFRRGDCCIQGHFAGAQGNGSFGSAEERVQELRRVYDDFKGNFEFGVVHVVDARNVEGIEDGPELAETCGTEYWKYFDYYVMVEVEDDEYGNSGGSADQKAVNEHLVDAYGKAYSSRADLERARKAQMSDLYENIEVPSSHRYLVKDGSNLKLYEVSDAKSQQTTAITSAYLFNDALVLVMKKKSLMTGKNRFIVDKAFLWSEIAVVDVKDAELINAVKILRYPDTFTYRCDNFDDKRSLMTAVKRITDEISMQKKRDKSVALSENHFGAMAAVSELPEEEEEYPETDDEALAVKKEEKASVKVPERDLFFLRELPDELDVLIAYRDFENAIMSIEKAHSILREYPEALSREREEVQHRSQKLASLISLQLANPDMHRNQVQWNIERLLRLGLGEQARDIFLTARTMTIRHRIRQLKFDGDISSYISDLSETVFRLLHNTCTWYGASFRAAQMASGFIQWVQYEIQNYATIFRRQVFDSKQDFATIATCLGHTMKHCNQLRDSGLDLSFVLDKLFYRDLEEAVEKHAVKCTDLISKSIARDSFGAVSWTSLKDEAKEAWEREFGDVKVRLSQCVYDFYSTAKEFGTDVSHLVSIPLYIKIVNSFKTFFTVYMNKLHDMFSKEWSHRQYFVMMVNANFVVKEMMQKLTNLWANELFHRPIPELEAHQVKMKGMLTTLHNAYVRLSSVKLITKDYHFPSIDYSSTAAILESAKPSEYMLKLILELHMICLEMDPSLDKKAIVIDIIQKLFEFMVEPRCWETEKGPRSFGYGGVQQLVLDIHFFLRIAELYISEQTNMNANSICEKALRLYFTQNKDIKTPLKSGEWYEKRVEEIMKTASKTYYALLVL